MAKPGRPMGKLHQEDVRSKIQCSLLVKKLEDHVLKGSELSATQIRAAEILLKKKVPDLTAVEMTGEDGGPIQQRVEMVIVDSQG